jgi:hypothetical protein
MWVDQRIKSRGVKTTEESTQDTLYILTVRVQGEGTVTTDPPISTFSRGEEVTLTAIPAPGWVFHSWSDSVLSPSRSIIINGDKNITAYFIRRIAITGQVTYDGKSITQYTTALPKLWCYDQSKGVDHTDDMTYDSATGTYTVSGVTTGRYTISLGFDAADPFDGWEVRPGDFRGIIESLDIDEGDNLVLRDIPLYQVIHLINPVDNMYEQGYVRDPKRIYRTWELTFTWEKIPEASTYKVVVSLYQEPFDYVGKWWEIETSDTKAVIPGLKPNNESQFYKVELDAYNSQGIRVGKMLVTYEDGMGWDYRFRIEW